MPKTVETDPITAAVEELIALIPAAHLEDKPVMQAFLNWFRSQEIEQEDMCTAIATLLGLFVGMRAESKAYLKASVATFSKQMRSAAAVSMEAKELVGNRSRSAPKAADRETGGPRRRLARGSVLFRRGESDPAVRLDWEQAAGGAVGRDWRPSDNFLGGA